MIQWQPVGKGLRPYAALPAPREITVTSCTVSRSLSALGSVSMRVISEHRASTIDGVALGVGAGDALGVGDGAALGLSAGRAWVGPSFDSREYGAGDVWHVGALPWVARETASVDLAGRIDARIRAVDMGAWMALPVRASSAARLWPDGDDVSMVPVQIARAAIGAVNGLSGLTLSLGQGWSGDVVSRAVGPMDTWASWLDSVSAPWGWWFDGRTLHHGSYLVMEQPRWWTIRGWRAARGEVGYAWDAGRYPSPVAMPIRRLPAGVGNVRPAGLRVAELAVEGWVTPGQSWMDASNRYRITDLSLALVGGIWRGTASAAVSAVSEVAKWPQ